MAEQMKWLHPMRVSRYVFADAFNPWMRLVGAYAGAVAKHRTPMPQDHPLIEHEGDMLAQATDGLEQMRKARDAALERMFEMLYAWPPARGASS